MMPVHEYLGHRRLGVPSPFSELLVGGRVQGDVFDCHFDTQIVEHLESNEGEPGA